MGPSRNLHDHKLDADLPLSLDPMKDTAVSQRKHPSIEIPWRAGDHAYSILTDAKNTGTLENVTSSEAKCVEDGWEVEVSVVVADGEKWGLSRRGLGKSVAKRMAAEAVLLLFQEPGFTIPEYKLPPGRKARNIEKKKAALAEILTFQSNGQTTVVSIDVEAWEKDTSKMTEIGIAWMLGGVLHARHIVIKDHISLRNGHHVPERRHLFQYGRSEVLSLNDAGTQIGAQLDYLRRDSHSLLLVGVGVSGDEKWMRDAKIDINKWVSCTCDIGLAMWENDGGKNQKSLETLLQERNVEREWMHNGGNDAVLAVRLFFMLVEELHT
ncbi:hypothetical protein ONS96_005297 [Cadophora gregata f. sp. sojae]|nr:hypothetical protein ONS96_005297 [Cadophora gregata f. sp. sojae]